MTGDRQSVAAEVAKAVGIESYWVEMSPQEKADRIRTLQEEGETVTMV